jgi:hypothetical protein
VLTHDITMPGVCLSIHPNCDLVLRYSRYGLGTCYLRMSKVRLAEYHYRKAAEINPKNAVLLGCVGMVSNVQMELESLVVVIKSS